MKTFTIISTMLIKYTILIEHSPEHVKHYDTHTCKHNVTYLGDPHENVPSVTRHQEHLSRSDCRARFRGSDGTCDGNVVDGWKCLNGGLIVNRTDSGNLESGNRTC